MELLTTVSCVVVMLVIVGLLFCLYKLNILIPVLAVGGYTTVTGKC